MSTNCSNLLELQNNLVEKNDRYLEKNFEHWTKDLVSRVRCTQWFILLFPRFSFSVSYLRKLTTAHTGRPTILCILDGWGYNPSEYYNAVLLAKTPNWDKLWGEQSQRESIAFLQASEGHVGLPDGQIGNSEVGHMHIGAGSGILLVFGLYFLLGRVVWQDICLISKAIKENTLKDQEALKEHISSLKKSGGTCHVLGLVSPGGVHSMQDHVAALAKEVSLRYRLIVS